jgi:hypothetical protein
MSVNRHVNNVQSEGIAPTPTTGIEDDNDDEDELGLGKARRAVDV